MIKLSIAQSEKIKSLVTRAEFIMTNKLKLREDFGALDVSFNYLENMLDVQIATNKFLELADGMDVKMFNRECTEFPFEAYFKINKMKVFTILDEDEKAEFDEVIEYEFV